MEDADKSSPGAGPGRLATLLLAGIFASLAIVAQVFEWSFVLGRRGFDIADGWVAHYIGGFWAWLALLTLSTLLPEAALRKKAGSLLTLVFAALLFGSMIYFVISKPA